MPQKTPTTKDQGQDIDSLTKRVQSLTGELLQERIIRLDFQMQLLKQWRDQCQRELNQLLGCEKNRGSLEGAHG